ncbi:polysaccharide biosynthesis C-terminal domain-containing protein [Ekhidna sp.]|uniref:lipopolysaccharide biosynthesis protein n=1 Tax=Ekhidna sp. TaxID=2608089 RepID=UPI003CCBAE6D
MSSSFIKFFPTFKQSERNRFFSFLLVVTLAGNVIILLLGYFLKDIIAARYVDTAPDYINYLSITAIIIIANSLFELFFSYSRSIMKVIFPSFLRDVYLRLGSLLLVIGFAFEWWSFDMAVTGLGLVYFLAFILLLIQLLIRHNFSFDFRFGNLSKEWRGRLFRFGTYSMALAGSFAIINNISYDQITSQLGSDLNGIYTTCFFIAVIVEMPRRNMSKVTSPVLSNEFAKQNMNEVDSLYKRGSITMSVIGMLLFIGIITNLQDLFDFIPKGEAFQRGFWVVVAVCLAKLALMASSFAGEIINFSHLYRYNLFFQAFAAIMLIVLNYYLISIWGLNGAAISYLVAIVFHILLKVLFVNYHFGIQPLIPAHLPLLVIGVVVATVAYFFQPGFHPAIDILIRSVLTSVFFIFLIYRFRISEDINKIIHSTFDRFLKINLPK